MPSHVHQSHCVIRVELQGCFVIHQSFFRSTCIKTKNNTNKSKRQQSYRKNTTFWSEQYAILQRALWERWKEGKCCSRYIDLLSTGLLRLMNIMNFSQVYMELNRPGIHSPSFFVRIYIMFLSETVFLIAKFNPAIPGYFFHVVIHYTKAKCVYSMSFRFLSK